ncbi:MAG: prepilin-type N-terminal cleavage/methylation domain-containing protein [Elusimicrobiota bacterium]
MKKRGFTLVELMIVIVIIGILAAVAIPKFADMVDKSKEGATKAQLTALRSALQVYYGDNEGKFPRTSVSQTNTPQADSVVLNTTLIPKYISDIGMAKLPVKTGNHTCARENSQVYVVNVPTQNASTTQGGWAYDGSDTNNTWGDLRVNCSGYTLTNVSWTSF